MNLFLCSIISYLIGSISPSYLLGKITKGIDIREYGDGNAGTMNAIAVLGLVPGIITAVFDVSKGVVVLFLSIYLFNLKGNLLLLPIFSVIAGHILPFYLKFKGGQGAATATGLILYFMGILVSTGKFPVYALLILGLLVAVIGYVTRIGEFVGLVVLPLIFYTTLFFGGIEFPSLVVIFLAIFLLGVNIYNIARKGMYVIHPDIEVKWWRVWIRPAASLFMLFYLLFGKGTVLFIVAGVAGIFLALDISRLMHNRVNRFFVKDLKYIFKKSEARKFSSMTLFLIASFAVLFIFPRDIAFLSLSFLIFGDMFSKIFGLRFGRKKLIAKRTLEGTLSYFSGSLVAGYIVSTLLGVNILMMIIGALAASLAELLSIAIDDNFSVGIISGIVMSALRYFKTI